MKNKPDLFVTLTIIYLALLTVCVAIYAILQLYVKEIDRETATNLMIWSATLFPSIALLYTFNSWRDQKGSEVLSALSKEYYLELYNLDKKIDDLTYELIEFFPIKKADIATLKKIDRLKQSIKEFKSNLDIISKRKNDKNLKNQIDKIVELFTNIHLSYINNKKLISDIDIYKELSNSIIEYETEFKEFKKNTNTILLSYTFFDDKSA